MPYIGQCLNFVFLPVASNDNDDLLSLPYPSLDLATIREIKQQLRDENVQNGCLLTSRKDRRFFQEVVDAERYILMRYFSPGAPEDVIRELKRHILNTYLAPKAPRKRKKKAVRTPEPEPTA
jgi:hypothetical protein